MIVLDSSAVVALMLREEAAPALADRLAQTAGERVMSTANFVEAGAVLAGRTADPLRGVADLEAFLEEFRVQLAPIDAVQARLALDARVRLGRGFGSAAKLNFGDCFAYALAKSLNAPLLFIGDDFANTDVTPALAANT